jgi:Holliday junction resolvase
MNVREKGKRAERELVALLKKQGYQARRVYGSGAIGTALKLNNDTGQALKGDVYVPELKLEIEVKNRADYPGWLDDLDGALAIEGDGEVWLVQSGPDLGSFLDMEVRCKTKSFSVSWFQKWCQGSPVLAIRLKRGKWVLSRRVYPAHTSYTSPKPSATKTSSKRTTSTKR